MQSPAKRAVIVGLLLAAAVVFVSLDASFNWMGRLIASMDRIIAEHEIGGAFLFVVLSALSAMLAFFSTAVVVPVAVSAWGKVLTVLFLWGGWLLGGMTSYVISRHLGRRVMRWFTDEQKLRPYEEWLTGRIGFRHVLLFQFAVPSEIPGYVLGLAAYPFRIYATALMIAELPFAVGAVYLGEGFLQRNVPLMIAVGAGGLLLMVLAGWAFRKTRYSRSGQQRTVST